MGLRVLLIRPNLCVRRGFSLHNSCSPPLGLAYLAASLLKQGHVVSIVDTMVGSEDMRDFMGTHICYGLSQAGLRGRIREFRPDVVGIGGFVSQFPLINQLVEMIKAYDSNLKVVLGGACPTSIPTRVLAQTRADFILQGEAESSFAQLLGYCEHGEYHHIEDIDGIAFRKDKEIVVKPKMYFEKNVSVIPAPARQLFENELYHQRNEPMPIVTSRGCPGSCAFCSAYLLAGRAWRPREAIEVTDEIEEIVRKWGYDTVSVFDDACNVDEGIKQEGQKGIVVAKKTIRCCNTPISLLCVRMEEPLSLSLQNFRQKCQ